MSMNMPPHELIRTFRSFTYSGDTFTSKTSNLLVESPLEIIINQDKHILIMFTPEMTRELVIGFMYTEGLISTIAEIEECIISPIQKEDGGQVIEAKVSISCQDLDPLSDKSGKRISYSSCGICGKENYYDLHRGLNRVKSRQRFSMNILNGFRDRLKSLQPLYKKTGGAHAAVLFDSTGKTILRCEDMGRHNALDKVVGSTLIREIFPEDKILVSSGRASLEMILKTARVGFPIFVAMSRPTSRAVEAAKFYNITLVDMAQRSNRIYSHVRRIEGF
jgi:FdhD protein